MITVVMMAVLGLSAAACQQQEESDSKVLNTSETPAIELVNLNNENFETKFICAGASEQFLLQSMQHFTTTTVFATEISSGFYDVLKDSSCHWRFSLKNPQALQADRIEWLARDEQGAVIRGLAYISAPASLKDHQPLEEPEDQKHQITPWVLFKTYRAYDLNQPASTPP